MKMNSLLEKCLTSKMLILHFEMTLQVHDFIIGIFMCVIAVGAVKRARSAGLFIQ